MVSELCDEGCAVAEQVQAEGVVETTNLRAVGSEPREELSVEREASDAVVAGIDDDELAGACVDRD